MAALGLLELASIAAGIRVGDAMAKRAPLERLTAGTVHPGKFLVLIEGDVASVEESLAAGREESLAAGREEALAAGREEAPESGLLDEIFLPDPHPDILPVLRGGRRDGPRRDGPGEAIGIVEIVTAASLLGAADRGLKGAEVALRELRLADDLGGKSYCLFQGALSDVEAAVELAVEGLRRPDLLAGRQVIAQIDLLMHRNLESAPDFWTQLDAREP